jgi:hypothetical protein
LKMLKALKFSQKETVVNRPVSFVQFKKEMLQVELLELS